MTPLQHQNSKVLDALNEGRLQGRLEAFEYVLKLLTDDNYKNIDMPDNLFNTFVGLVIDAEKDYENWFK